jgi:hypothetical protein
MKQRSVFVVLLGASLLAGCATQAPETIVSTAPGFWFGVWHGFIAGFALIGQLFDSSISIYSVPNNGAGYGFGWVIGLVLSCGSITTGTVRYAHHDFNKFMRENQR